MSEDTVELACSLGTIDRDDRCGNCGAPMYYRMAAPMSGVVVASLCPEIMTCAAALLEIPE